MRFRLVRLATTLTVAAVVLVAIVLLVVPRVVLEVALDRINSGGQSQSDEDVRRAATREGAAALARIQDPELLLRLRAEDLQMLLAQGVQSASEAGVLPVVLSNVELHTGAQVIEISASIRGALSEYGITIEGSVAGVLAPSFDGRTFVLRPAFSKLQVTSLQVRGWYWLPTQLVQFVNPAIAATLDRLNGAIPPMRSALLSVQSGAGPLRIAGQEFQIPDLSPLPPALLIDQAGVMLITQFVAPSAPVTSADTVRAEPEYSPYRAAFLAQVRAAFPNAEALALGIYLSDSFLDRALGAYRAPGGLDEVLRAAIAANARTLNELRGPDVVLRVTANEASQLIANALEQALAQVSDPRFRVSEPRHRFRDGALEVTATIDSRLPLGEDAGVVETRWSAGIAVAASGEPDRSAVILIPRVTVMRLDSLLVRGRSLDPATLLPAINELAEAVRGAANAALPRIPIPLPVVPPDPVDLGPFSFPGGQATMTPPRFVPPSYRIERAVTLISARGIWVVADVTAQGMPERSPPSGSVIGDTARATALGVEQVITAIIRERLGEPPDAGVWGFASWRRFAEMFNFAWAALSPRAVISVDTGSVQIPSHGINLMEHASFECRRTRSCSRGPCEQRACSRHDCGGECPRIGIPQVCVPRICTPRIFGGSACVGGECTGGGWTYEPSCAAQRQACNSAADIEYGRCQATAVAEKAACDAREEAARVACNGLAEQEVAFCQGRRLLTNAAAEVSGVGAISGDARIRAQFSLDLRNLALNPAMPSASLSLAVSGGVSARIGLDWVPYDVIGHVFTCPGRERLSVETSAAVARPIGPLGVAIAESQPNAPNGSPIELRASVDSFRIPIRLQPGLLTALYTQNPQIVITCPVASTLLGVAGLVVGGSYRVISEGDIGAALGASPLPSSAAMLLSMSQNDDVRAGLGVLFGGLFDVKVPAQVVPIRLSEKSIALPGGVLIVRPTLRGRAFGLVARRAG